MRELKILGYIPYNTEQGDTFDALALTVYRDEKLSSVIIQANPDYCDVLIFDAGVTLNIPVIDTTEMPDTLPPWRRNT